MTYATLPDMTYATLPADVVLAACEAILQHIEQTRHAEREHMIAHQMTKRWFPSKTREAAIKALTREALNDYESIGFSYGRCESRARALRSLALVGDPIHLDAEDAHLLISYLPKRAACPPATSPSKTTNTSLPSCLNTAQARAAADALSAALATPACHVNAPEILPDCVIGTSHAKDCPHAANHTAKEQCRFWRETNHAVGRDS